MQDLRGQTTTRSGADLVGHLNEFKVAPIRLN